MVEEMAQDHSEAAVDEDGAPPPTVVVEEEEEAEVGLVAVGAVAAATTAVRLATSPATARREVEVARRAITAASPATSRVNVLRRGRREEEEEEEEEEMLVEAQSATTVASVATLPVSAPTRSVVMTDASATPVANPATSHATALNNNSKSRSPTYDVYSRARGWLVPLLAPVRACYYLLGRQSEAWRFLFSL